jgi:glucose/mannose-6-phosphate isomerase
MMNQYIAQYTDQLKEAVQISKSINVQFDTKSIQHIVAAGLGGSGIGGTILKDLVSDVCPVPVITCKDYHLPAFVNENTLVICSSYSGNTEETLFAFHAALKKGAKIFCITSGGKLADLCKANKIDYITVPGGKPPRACLSYSLVQLLALLQQLGYYTADVYKEIETAIQLIEGQQSMIQELAMSIAKKGVDKIPALYALEGCEGIVTRFQQQIQENSKMLCWHNMIPEMNHNELVGWASNYPQVAVMAIRSKFDFERNIQRFNIIQPILESKCDSLTVIEGKGDTKLIELLYLVNVTDWISFYMADLKQVDSIEVNVIDYLKASLEKKA